MNGVVDVCAVRLSGPQTGCPVVLLHPIAVHGEIWAMQLPVWSREFRVVNVDLPGHGASKPLGATPALADYADCVVAALDRLGIGEAAFVGMSLGGIVAQAISLRYQPRVRALVLAQTTARVDNEGQRTWAQRREDARTNGLQSQVAAMLDRWFTAEFRATAPLTVRWVGEIIRATSIAGYLDATGAIQAVDHLAELENIQAPALVIAGGRDAAVTPELARQLADRLPSARFTVLKDSGHLANIDSPVAFTELVGQFLRDIAGARRAP